MKKADVARVIVLTTINQHMHVTMGITLKFIAYELHWWLTYVKQMRCYTALYRTDILCQY